MDAAHWVRSWAGMRLQISRPYVRLRSKLCELSTATQIPPPNADPNDLRRIRAALKKAEAAYAKYDLDAAWRCAHLAERLRLRILSETEVRARGVALIEEARAKLKTWRRDAVVGILVNIEQKSGNDLRDRVTTATTIRDDHFANQYYKISLSRLQQIFLAVVLVGAIAVFLVMVDMYRIEPGKPVFAAAGSGSQTAIALSASTSSLAMGPSKSTWTTAQFFVTVLLAGAIGACVTAITHFAQTSANLSVPERLANWWLTIMRPVVGATAALAVFFFVHGGILVLDLGQGVVAGAWGIAFASGFSERLLVKAVGTVAP